MSGEQSPEREIAHAREKWEQQIADAQLRLAIAQRGLLLFESYLRAGRAEAPLEGGGRMEVKPHLYPGISGVQYVWNLRGECEDVAARSVRQSHKVGACRTTDRIDRREG